MADLSSVCQSGGGSDFSILPEAIRTPLCCAARSRPHWLLISLTATAQFSMTPTSVLSPLGPSLRWTPVPALPCVELVPAIVSSSPEADLPWTTRLATASACCS